MRARKSIVKSKVKPTPPELDIRIPENVLRAAMLHVARQDVRYYLNGVHFEPTPDGVAVMVVATDGHRMIASRVAQDTPVPKAYRKSFIISAVSLTTLLRTLAKSDTVVSLTGVDKESRCMRSTVWGSGAKKKSSVRYGYALLDMIDGRFPDWAPLLATALNVEPSHGHVNGRYVLDALKANAFLMSTISSRKNGFWECAEDIVVRKGETSAVVHYRDGNTLGMIMPLRSSGSAATTPDWGKALAAAALAKAAKP